MGTGVHWGLICPEWWDRYPFIVYKIFILIRFIINIKNENNLWYFIIVSKVCLK